MKKIVLIAMIMSTSIANATDAKNEWHETSLSEATIKNIQQSQYQYKKCVTEEMQKLSTAKIESKSSTDKIMKQCEKVLSTMRQVYLDEKVPGVIADRHLKKLRIDITRRVLKQLMLTEAARSKGKK